MIVIIDYNLSNLNAVLSAVSYLGFKAEITNDILKIKNAEKLILPGVGAFADCRRELGAIDGLFGAIEEHVKSGKPFMGICVGMQLLADKGYENGVHQGLGWIKGSIRKLEVNKLKLPHMGWNTIQIINNSYEMSFDQKKNDYYFVHSYFFDCFDEKNIIASTKYGLDFPSIVGKENIYGVQFHPEKSSEQGLGLINNFLSL